MIPFSPKTPSHLRPDEVGSLIRRTPSFKDREEGDLKVSVGVKVDEAPPPQQLSAPGSPTPEINITPVGSPGPSSPRAEEPVGLKTSDAWKGTEQVKKVKRTESQKREQRTRTLSLKTRRHTPSFKDKYKSPGEQPPVDMEGLLERKQELQNGGKKATIRSWRFYHTVLCGQLLCFFKDEQGKAKTIRSIFFI